MFLREICEDNGLPVYDVEELSLQQAMLVLDEPHLLPEKQQPAGLFWHKQIAQHSVVSEISI
ncbi:MAG: hypothetical protein KZQ58_05890 [gamma proteobacterium symbiont of Bathyaustriella thionipta]|nr:hypothetical protein [gamma proteobacterium symbiont of Bathyaustriella thionipta]